MNKPTHESAERARAAGLRDVEVWTEEPVPGTLTESRPTSQLKVEVKAPNRVHAMARIMEALQEVLPGDFVVRPTWQGTRAGPEPVPALGTGPKPGAFSAS